MVMRLSMNNSGQQLNSSTTLSHNSNMLNSVMTSATYGCISSFSSALILQPLDRLKTISQQNVHSHASAYMNLKNVITKYGVLDLWRGVVPTLFRVVPGVALYFGFLEACQYSTYFEKYPHFRNFFVGFMCRSCTVALLMPATVIKTRFESNLYRDRNVYLAAKNILKLNGPRVNSTQLLVVGLFKGILPTIMRDAPFSGVYLTFYRQNNQLWCKYFGSVSISARFFCGVAAGIFACALTQPFDIVKTQLQLYPKRFNSSAQVIIFIYKQGGLSSFFNGFLLRAGRRTAMAALSWTVFDGVRNLVYSRFFDIFKHYFLKNLLPKF
uniref:Mitochondrial glycine transporter n=1 Tax=Syphacia muris TaxID=451379 RepID=A0A0N5AIF3_9BILA